MLYEVITPYTHWFSGSDPNFVYKDIERGFRNNFV